MGENTRGVQGTRRQVKKNFTGRGSQIGQVGKELRIDHWIWQCECTGDLEKTNFSEMVGVKT